MHIEIKIREARENKDMTLSKLAKRASISKSHLSNVERGEKEPSISILIRIALVLKVDEKELYKIYY